MEILRFIPVRLTLLLVGGILIGRTLEPDPACALLSVLLSFATLGIAFWKCKSENSFLFAFAVILTVLSFGILSYSLSIPKNHPRHYSHFEWAGANTMGLKILEVLKPSDYYGRYIATIHRLDKEQVAGRILLRVALAPSAVSLQVDDEVLVYGTLDALRPPLNPYQFNYKAYMESLGVYHRAQPSRETTILKLNAKGTLAGHAAQLRNRIIGRLAKTGFGADELAIVQALLLGQRNDLSFETYDAFKKAGAVHILAVSGLHIGILLWFLHLLLRPLEKLPRGKIIKLLLLLVLLWSYALLAGLSASVTRAASMFSFVAYALYLNRPANTFNILSLSMFFILLLANARLLFHPGFQLSYAAVFAIVWLYPQLQAWWRPNLWIVQKGWQLLSVSLAAQMGVLPISLYYFHQFPALFFISNLVIMPFLGLILGAGFTMVGLALFKDLPVAFTSLYEMLIGCMNQLIFWVSRQEAFIFEDIPFSFSALCMAYLLIIAFCRFLERPRFRNALLLIAGIMGLQLWNIFQVSKTNSREDAWLLHQWGTTLLIHQKGSSLEVASSSGEAPIALLKNFRSGGRIRHINEVPLRAGYQWGHTRLYLMGQEGPYPSKTGDSIYLLLRNNPKLHLERLLDSLRPQLVIADGSNYTSYVSRWQTSCKKRKVRFHNTAEQGALRLNIH